MLSAEKIEKIKTLAHEVSEREGCVLYDVEFTGSGKHRILRVMVEGQGAPVTIDQCANVSRGLSLLLDVEDVVPGSQYDLEVSSPGLERPLREKWHFEKAKGQRIAVVTNDFLEGLKTQSLKGTLGDVTETGFTLEHDKGSAHVNFANVKRAQVVFDYAKSEKKR
jgi:ribosome maturation factor RimP